jgi:hypothetical protein
VRTIIKADTVYYEEGSTKQWGSGLAETVVVGTPIDLRIIELLSEEPKAVSSKVHGTFWLSPNAMLSPWYSRTRLWTGEITVNRSNTFEFTLLNRLHLIFTHHYRYLDGENGETVSFPELKAEFETEAEIEEVSSWLEPLDDFLVITSFAAREPCACVGWDAYQAAKYIKVFRRNVVIPRREARHSIHEGLVDLGGHPKPAIKGHFKTGQR